MPKNTKQTNNTNSVRPPIVTVMGHIDHGKSTLLDSIRKTNLTENEAGGITQHISAYEVEWQPPKKKESLCLTFLDTPGHEAFGASRGYSTMVADIAILAVSAEDGVMPQTKEALETIRSSNTPFIVAITKIDAPQANVEKTKSNLIENEIYIEGYGGDISYVPVSAKTGEGLPELLDMIALMAELEEMTGNKANNASGVIIESSLNPQKGITADAIITDGTLRKGMFVVADGAYASVRFIEDFKGDVIESATFSSPVKLTGWNTMPSAGVRFESFDTKKEAEKAIKAARSEDSSPDQAQNDTSKGGALIPIVVKADTTGNIEAVSHEIDKLRQEVTDRPVHIKVISGGTGAISENDLRLAMPSKDVQADSESSAAMVLGFNVKVDDAADRLAGQHDISIKTSGIIYELSDWLKETVLERIPTEEVEEMTGSAKIKKLFSRRKDKQVVGGTVKAGSISSNQKVRVKRGDAEIANGTIGELQHFKEKVSEVNEGNDFGATIECRMEIVPGDIIESYKKVRK